jgi:hypothetical protein
VHECRVTKPEYRKSFLYKNLESQVSLTPRKVTRSQVTIESTLTQVILRLFLFSVSVFQFGCIGISNPIRPSPVSRISTQCLSDESVTVISRQWRRHSDSVTLRGPPLASVAVSQEGSWVWTVRLR